jgi:hypothetical protein
MSSARQVAQLKYGTYSKTTPLEFLQLQDLQKPAEQQHPKTSTEKVVWHTHGQRDETKEMAAKSLRNFLTPDLSPGSYQHGEPKTADRPHPLIANSDRQCRDQPEPEYQITKS